jgi:tripartite-type tricarboxylate transporter receptor subunit TctC
VNSVAELVALLKKQPGMAYASSGVGSNQHFLGEAFAKAAGVKIEHVPYRGAGQAINDLIAGHVKVAFLGPTALLPQHETGAVRMLAQSSAKRSVALPDLPTLQESGFADLDIESWYGVLLPLGTPPAIAARLNTELRKILGEGASRESLVKAGNEPGGGSAEEFAAVLKAYSEKYARLAKELNIGN